MPLHTSGFNDLGFRVAPHGRPFRRAVVNNNSEQLLCPPTPNTPLPTPSPLPTLPSPPQPAARHFNKAGFWRSENAFGRKLNRPRYPVQPTAHCNLKTTMQAVLSVSTDCVLTTMLLCFPPWAAFSCMVCQAHNMSTCLGGLLVNGLIRRVHN